MTTLLEKAIAAETVPRRGFAGNEEDHELALAWAEERVSLKAVAIAWGIPPKYTANVYKTLAVTLGNYAVKNREGRLEVKKNVLAKV